MAWPRRSARLREQARSAAKGASANGRADAVELAAGAIEIDGAQVLTAVVPDVRPEGADGDRPTM